MSNLHIQELFNHINNIKIHTQQEQAAYSSNSSNSSINNSFNINRAIAASKNRAAKYNEQSTFEEFPQRKRIVQFSDKITVGQLNPSQRKRLQKGILKNR